MVQVTMTCCGILKCFTHKTCVNHPGHRCCDMLKPCIIQLKGGDLIIHTHAVCFMTKHEKITLYEAKYHFTRDHLLTLNEIDSQEPEAFVNVLKGITHPTIKIEIDNK